MSVCYVTFTYETMKRFRDGRGRPASLFPYGFCLQNACSSLSPSQRRCAHGEARSILVLFSDRVAASRFASSPMHGRLNRAPRLGPPPAMRAARPSLARLAPRRSPSQPAPVLRETGENDEPRLLRRLWGFNKIIHVGLQDGIRHLAGTHWFLIIIDK